MFPMKLIVQKFGGTSVADTSSLKIVAERIIDRKKEGYELVELCPQQWDQAQMN